MLINLTNHPFVQWSNIQKKAALSFGICIDLPFPVVDPSGDEVYIEQLAEEFLYKITKIVNESSEEVSVHLMGEMTFVYALLAKLRQAKIRCIASTTERHVEDLGNGRKDMQFTFVRFRDYYSLL